MEITKARGRISALVRNWLGERSNILILLLMLFGCVLRLYGTSTVPGGLNQDEAYAGYNAWSLLNYGVDSFGYHNPVYFTAWGSGMNALETYLCMPFIAIFGRKAGAVRLPQGIVACLSLWVFYLLIKELKGKKTAIMGLFVFAVCPWHIMLSRWGLESNLLPGFLLFGFYFFVLAVKKDMKYMYASAVCYGLSLYCYAVIWPVLPFIIAIQVAYCVWCRGISLKNVHLWASAVILGVMAVPLFLFLLVNAGVIDEIRTSVISVPRLVSMRNDELSPGGIVSNLRTFTGILMNQSDGHSYNAVNKYGIYYKFSNWIVALGIGTLIAGSCKSVKERSLDAGVMLCIQMVFYVLLGVIMDVNINRCNYIWIPLIICLVLGIGALEEKLGKQCRYSLVIAYVVSFASFILFYVNDFRFAEIDDYFVGAGQIIEEASQYDGEIVVADDLDYSVVMFYDGMSPYEFMETVQWTNYPSKYLDVSKIGRYTFVNADDIADYDAGAYVVRSKNREILEEMGLETYTYMGYTIGVRE